MPLAMSDTEKFLPKIAEYVFSNVPIDDPRVWRLFHKGDTKGVFQLEKKLGQDWAKKVRPNNMEELAALVSILRPGPLESGMADSYAGRKNGKQSVTYVHESLKPILSSTYGCLIYQEQIMKICTELAGFDEVQSDTMRKAVGKKKPEIMAKTKVMFMEGIEKAKVVSNEIGEEIFGWIQKSVRYSFNKSHAVCYAAVAYFCAYQKVHYPYEFFTSWLTYSDWKPSPREEIYELVQNARMNNIEIYPPSIVHKNVDFEIVHQSGEKGIIFGLSHIRDVGTKTIEKIKKSKNTFEDFAQFLSAVKLLKRNVAQSLIKSGACDSYGLERCFMLKCLYAVMGHSDRDREDTLPQHKKLTPPELKHFLNKLPDMGMIGALEDIVEQKVCIKRREPTIKAKVEYIKQGAHRKDSNAQNSIWEKLLLGLNLTCSAVDDVDKTEFSDYVRGKSMVDCRQFVNSVRQNTNVAMFVVIDRIANRTTGPMSKTPGKRYCYLDISDNTGAYDRVVVWPEVFEKCNFSEIPEGTVLLLIGKKNVWRDSEQLVVDNAKVIG